MERLSFSFYRALFSQIEMYESLLSQLQRDYARELRGDTLFFAVDFSELYEYLHFTAQGAPRVALNTYVLNALENQFTLLPGAVGELLTDLEKAVPTHLKPDLTKALYEHPSVVEFLSNFPEVVQDDERLIELYRIAETDLRSTLGDVLDILILGRRCTSIQALQDLLRDGKIRPVEGVQDIGSISAEDRALARLVESYLTLSRPYRTESNRIDAMDFLFALLLNRQQDPQSKRYVIIYSQAISFIQACRSHQALQWDDDYLVREAKYLQFRTRIQKMFQDRQQRHEYVTESRELAQKLKREISKLVDIDRQLQEEEAFLPSLVLLDLYRRFDEECVQPLAFSGESTEMSVTRERAQRLYDLLRDEGRFIGQAEEAYEVLKTHLRAVRDSLQVFVPAATESEDVRMYKTSLQQWLESSDSES